MCLRCCFGGSRKSVSAPSTSGSPPQRAEDPPKAKETLQPPESNKPIPPQEIALQRQIPPVPESLPSQVEETFAACPKFRVVVIGNSGIGKSTLVRRMFNVDPKDIDIAHDRAGDADIDRQYESPQNPRFILHDSKGFEAGSGDNWETVKKFLQKRHKHFDLSSRIHAIWFCILTPRTGMRLLQTADEELLLLAKELNIPIIAVFTKYDLLVNQFLAEDDKDADSKALSSFDESVRQLRGVSPIPCVRMSKDEQDMLINLTKETLTMLREVEKELWPTAQQVNARQKVDLSISEGFKKYWLDLGQSTAFEGQTLIDCVHRVHDDVLKVWNFNDPTKILSGTDYFTEMIGLVKPLVDGQVDETLLRPAHVSGFGSTGAEVLVPLLRSFGFGLPAIQYLYDKYQRYPSTAKFLATYIINLILVMHGVFADLLPSEPPRVLSNQLVSQVLRRHKTDLRKDPLDNIDSVPEFAANPEQVIASVIRKRLRFEAGGDH